jgi:hypothetical protein
MKWNDTRTLELRSLKVRDVRLGCGVLSTLAAAALGLAGTADMSAQAVNPPAVQIASTKNDNTPPASNRGSASGPALNPSLHAIDDREPVTGGAAPVVETNGPLHTCDDGVSASLQQDAPNLPCWANIRTVDHWNSMFIPEGVSFHEAESTEIPAGVPSSFSYSAGGLTAGGLPDGQEAKVYGGLFAAAGLVEKQRWQLMAEDAGGAGDYQLGGAHFAGLNRFAMRATGELSDRWTWQGNATNTYGTDALRLFAPLDYRMIGNSEAPAADTVAYGLHGGEVLDQEEGVKMRFANSERSHWDFSAADVYRHYTDDGFSTQTVHARAEYLHAVTRDMAIGVFGDGAHQTNALACSLGGGGVRLLSQWGPKASLNISGAVNAATASCGNNVEFTGDAAFYYSFSPRTDVYVSADRGLGDGAVERAVFLDTAGVGVRHTFRRQIAVGLTGNALYGVDPRLVNGVKDQSLHGSFAEVSVRYPLRMGFSQESAFRHYSVAGTPIEPNRSVAVFTLWWAPAKRREAASQ